MNLFRTLRSFLGFDHLTYTGMFRLLILVLSVFVLLAVAQIHFGLGLDVYGQARSLYQGKGLAAGEAVLARHLARNPDDAKGYIQLARNRGRFERLALLQKEITPPDYRNPGAGPVPSAPRPEILRPALNEDDYRLLVDQSSRIDPGILDAYRVGDREGGDRAQSRLLKFFLEDAARRTNFRHLADAGDLCRLVAGGDAGLSYYREALKFQPDESSGRVRAVQNGILEILLAEGERKELTGLLGNPDYRAAADPNLLYRHHLEQGEYAAMFPPFFVAEVLERRANEIIAALVVGAGWFFFLLHMGRGLDRGVSFWITAGVAFLLGAASAVATLYVVVIQNHLLGPADESRGIVFNLVNAVFGIGLREELIKLIFAAPLALVLLREKDPLKIFTLTSMVGLGFAVEENINYYLYGGEAVVARFLTANFLHMTLTGYVGYYFVRAAQGKEKWESFSESFFLMVLCHGLYDFFLIEPTLADLSWLAYTVYIWISQKYLRLLVSMRQRKGGEASLTQVFLFALFVAVGTAYWQLARSVGYVQGLLDLVTSLLGVAIILIMFFREFDEPVIRKR